MGMGKCTSQDMLITNCEPEIMPMDFFPLGHCIIHPVQYFRYTATCTDRSSDEQACASYNNPWPAPAGGDDDDDDDPPGTISDRYEDYSTVDEQWRYKAVDAAKAATGFTIGDYSLTFYNKDDVDCTGSSISAMADWPAAGVEGKLGCTCFQLPDENSMTVNIGFGSRPMGMGKCTSQDMLITGCEADEIMPMDFFPLGNCIIHPVAQFRYTATCTDKSSVEQACASYDNSGAAGGGVGAALAVLLAFAAMQSGRGELVER